MRISRSGDWISQIKHLGGRIFEKILVKSGVDAFNGPQGRILDVLWLEDGISAKELSKRTSLAGSTLTSMLDRMEAQNLVRRAPSPTDRRAVLIFLTDEARRLKGKYDEVSAEMTEIYFRGFSDSEVEQFENALQRVLENLKEEDKNE